MVSVATLLSSLQEERITDAFYSVRNSIDATCPCSFNVLRLVIDGASNNNLLSAIPQDTTRSWRDICSAHQLIVLGNVSNASMWVELVQSAMLRGQDECSEDMWRGTYAGFLRVISLFDACGITIDAQASMIDALQTLTISPNGGKERYLLDNDPKTQRDLALFIESFVLMPDRFDDDVTKNNVAVARQPRQDCVKSMLDEISHHATQESLTPFKGFFVEQLSQAYMKTRPSLEQARMVAS